ncbi:MAG TPA: alpha/beta fold hydrolase [Actinomycetota bacterium]|jgi:pimeloyl-ACP methyl ester carboxylesterase|nr:alpha/beta fold hydrolase [Actinomycetota bacterium]
MKPTATATTAPGVYKTPEGEHAVKSAYRQLLEHWPVPAAQRIVPTGQGDTFALTCGPADAAPLVLLHGSGTNNLMWAGHVATWAEHFRIHAIDMIGEPGLSAPSRPPLDSEAYAAWLDDVFDGLALTQAAIVATSLGGWLALDYAIRRPGRVTRLALMAPGGVGRQKWGVLITAILLRPFGRRGLMITMRRALGVPLASATASPQATALGAFTLLVHRHFRPRLDRLPLFSTQALTALDVPMLTIVGGRDAMVDSHQTRQRLEQAGKSAHLLPQAGHLLPDQTRPILDFLRAGDPR